MQRVARSLKIAYAVTAFAAALAMQSCSGGTAYAQSMEPPYSESAHLEHSVEVLTGRVDDIGERIARIEGIGAGSIAGLGALQILSMIVSAKTKKEA